MLVWAKLITHAQTWGWQSTTSFGWRQTSNGGWARFRKDTRKHWAKSKHELFSIVVYQNPSLKQGGEDIYLLYGRNPSLYWVHKKSHNILFIYFYNSEFFFIKIKNDSQWSLKSQLTSGFSRTIGLISQLQHRSKKFVIEVSECLTRTLITTLQYRNLILLYVYVMLKIQWGHCFTLQRWQSACLHHHVNMHCFFFSFFELVLLASKLMFVLESECYL